MPNVGPLELIVVLIIALVIFGPKRLPELGRPWARASASSDARSAATDDDDDDDQSPKPAADRGRADRPIEPVEGEVVTDQRC